MLPQKLGRRNDLSGKQKTRRSGFFVKRIYTRFAVFFFATFFFAAFFAFFFAAIFFVVFANRVCLPQTYYANYYLQ